MAMTGRHPGSQRNLLPDNMIGITVALEAGLPDSLTRRKTTKKGASAGVPAAQFFSRIGSLRPMKKAAKRGSRRVPRKEAKAG
jgi:hypothetical protein